MDAEKTTERQRAGRQENCEQSHVRSVQAIASNASMAGDFISIGSMSIRFCSIHQPTPAVGALTVINFTRDDLQHDSIIPLKYRAKFSISLRMASSRLVSEQFNTRSRKLTLNKG